MLQQVQQKERTIHQHFSFKEFKRLAHKRMCACVYSQHLQTYISVSMNRFNGWSVFASLSVCQIVCADGLVKCLIILLPTDVHLNHVLFVFSSRFFLQTHQVPFLQIVQILSLILRKIGTNSRKPAANNSVKSPN